MAHVVYGSSARSNRRRTTRVHSSHLSHRVHPFTPETCAIRYHHVSRSHHRPMTTPRGRGPTMRRKHHQVRMKRSRRMGYHCRSGRHRRSTHTRATSPPCSRPSNGQKRRPSRYPHRSTRRPSLLRIMTRISRPKFRRNRHASRTKVMGGRRASLFPSTPTNRRVSRVYLFNPFIHFLQLSTSTFIRGR